MSKTRNTGALKLEFSLSHRDYFEILLFPAAAIFLSLIAFFMIQYFSGVKTLTQLVAFLKACSFFALICASFSAMYGEESKVIYSANALILLFMFVLTLLLSAKVFEHELLSGESASLLVLFFKSVFYHLTWVSVLPLFAFVVLDLYQYFSKTYQTRRDRTLIYLLFVDLICATPIALVLAIASSSSFLPITSVETDGEIFLGGAMAFLVFAHSIAERVAHKITDKMACLDISRSDRARSTSGKKGLNP